MDVDAFQPPRPRKQGSDTAKTLVSNSSLDIRSFLIKALAQHRATDTESLEHEIRENGGDLELDSLEGLTVVSALEGELGRSLPGPEDLKNRENFISIGALTALIERTL